MPRPTRSRSDLDLAKVDWRQVDGTSEDEIAQQADSDRDTAPVFGPEEILAAGRRVEPDMAEDVRALRTRLGLSQEAFAARFGFTVDAIRQYEGRRRAPTGPARTLLRVIAREPDAVIRALSAGQRCRPSCRGSPASAQAAAARRHSVTPPPSEADRR